MPLCHSTSGPEQRGGLAERCECFVEVHHGFTSLLFPDSVVSRLHNMARAVCVCVWVCVCGNPYERDERGRDRQTCCSMDSTATISVRAIRPSARCCTLTASRLPSDSDTA